MDVQISLPPGLAKARIRYEFNAKRRHGFYEDMASFVGEGITPFQAIEQMHKVARPRRTMRWLVRLLDRVIVQMKAGKSMPEALAQWVPPEESAMLLAGERGGMLRDALIELHGLLEMRLKVGASLKGNLLPAAAMLGVLVLLTVYILNTVLKEARGLVSDEAFDSLMLAPLYFNGGEAFLKALPFAVPALFLFSIAVAMSLPRWRPTSVRKWLDKHVPPYSLYVRVQSSFFLLTAASMMQAGAPFRQALEDISRSANPWTRTHLRRQLNRLNAGASEVEAMTSGMLPWQVEDKLSVYRILDDFKRVMRVTANDSMKLLLRRVDFIGTAIRGTVMALLGAFIIFTVFSIGEIALEAQSSINKAQRAQ